MSDKFEEWLDKSFEGEYLMRSRRLLVKDAWNHQQQKIDKLESLLKEACSFVEYAEKNKYRNTGFSIFLNKPEIKKIRGEEV